MRIKRNSMRQPGMTEGNENNKLKDSSWNEGSKSFL